MKRRLEARARSDNALGAAAASEEREGECLSPVPFIALQILEAVSVFLWRRSGLRSGDSCVIVVSLMCHSASLHLCSVVFPFTSA